MNSPSSIETVGVNHSHGMDSHFDFPSNQEDDFYSFHCHWNHCDFSFTSLFELDDHLFNHIPPQPIPVTTVPVDEDIGYQCQWDECQTKAHTETDLVKHVKKDHLPDTSKEHHQCLWVNENGIR